MPGGDTKGGRRLHFGTARRSALTLLEIVIAMALMAVVMAAMLPQFRNIENSWASKQGRSEALQNARILIEHVNRNLQRAERIEAVSAPAVALGFIQYQASDGITYRYEVSGNNTVQFGPVDNLAELGGPVSRLQFHCYDLHNFSTPTTDADAIRLVKANIAVVNTSAAAQDEQVDTCAHLRVSGSEGRITGIKPRLFSSFAGQESALAEIDDRHFLCAYSDSIRGWAVVLAVNENDWTIAKGENYRFESDLLLTPALAKIDDEHYLCAYVGPDLDGWAVVLTVNRDDWTVSKETAFEFDSGSTLSPTLCRIDDAHYLVAYTGRDLDGWAAVLTVNTADWTLSRAAPVEFDTACGLTPALSQIDDTHILCTYTGTNSDGWAFIMDVDDDDWSLTAKSPRKFDTVEGLTPSLCRIDSTHHLCAYQGTGRNGWAVVLGINDRAWSVTPGTAFQFDAADSAWPALCRFNDNHFLVAYDRPGFLTNKGIAALLAVNTETWAVSTAISATEYTPDGDAPVLMALNTQHALCAYDGLWFRGTATVLEVIQGGGP